MRIFVIGAGEVGSTIVESLHAEHDLTLVDVDEQQLAKLAGRFDIRVVEGDGGSRRALEAADVAEANLVIARTSRDESGSAEPGHVSSRHVLRQCLHGPSHDQECPDRRWAAP